MTGLKEKVAVITGATSGIGADIARLFVEEGAKVVLTGRSTERGEAIEKELGENAFFVSHDVASEASWEEVMSATKEIYGRLDILVNNAAMMKPASIEDTDFELFEKTILTNAGSVFVGCKKAIAMMKEHGDNASLVNVASTTAVRTSPWTCAYGASKAAILNMTQSIALHCATSGYNIRCNAVLPGVVMTTMVQDLLNDSPDPDATLAGLTASQTIGRLLGGREIATAVRYLASEDSSGVTGTHILVDGGQTAGSF